MRFRQYLLASAVLAGSAWSVSAQAQDKAADTADKGGNQEIIVTAQFREQSLQDTPIAISAVTSQMLESRGQTSVYQVANQVPSVTLKPSVGNLEDTGLATRFQHLADRKSTRLNSSH